MTQISQYSYDAIYTPSHRFYKLGWNKSFSDQRRSVENSKSSLVIIGDSIASGFLRYQEVWSLFRKFKALNLGIGGDKCENVLWRCQHINFPPSVQFAVIICGVNNIDRDDPYDIAKSLINIG